MSKYIASIVLIAAVVCGSSLAYPFSESSEEFIPTDEGKLHRDLDKARKEHEVRHGAFWNDEATLRRNQKHESKASSSRKHKREPGADKDEELEKKSAEEIIYRIIIVKLTVGSVKESERASLEKTLEDAAQNQHWNNINDFIAYCAKMKVKADLHAEGVDLDDSDFDFSLNLSNEA